MKIICEADQNESSVVLKIPGTDTISYEYSEGELAEGTWMLVGDDDRLRANYVDAMMHIGPDEAKQRFIQTDKGKKFYRYRTSFSLNYQQELTEPQEGSGEFWRLFTHQNIGGTQKIALDPDALDEDGIQYRYRYVQGKKWKGDPYQYKELKDQVEKLNVAMGHTKEKATIEFRCDDDGTHYVKYGLRVIQKNKLETTPSSEANDAESGWIQTGKNHWFYYELLEGDSSAGNGGGSSGSDLVSAFPYHTGAVFNFVDEDNYELLSFEMNGSKEMVLRSYGVRGGKASNYKTEEVLSGFEFNESYTLDMRVEANKVIVNLSDGLLEADLSFTTLSKDIQPAIGFYMNQDVDLGNDNAIANANDALPLVNDDTDSTKGPTFQLMAMPEFYPYRSETPSKPVEQEKPKPPSIRRIGIETLTINPVAFLISTDVERDYVMTLRLPNGSTQTITSRQKEFFVSRSGNVSAYVEVNGVKSETVQFVVDNIIVPFTEIDGTYTVGSKETSFTLNNFEEVMQEIKSFQKQEKLKLIMETKGKRTEIKKMAFTIKNKDLDLNDFAIFVESE